MLVTARRYDTELPVELEIEKGKIRRITPLTIDPGQVDSLPWVAPGLIDLQVNGYGGQEFSSEDLTIAHVRQTADYLASQGVVRFCPTLTTQRHQTLLHAMGVIALGCRQNPVLGRRIPCIHLEGPFITQEDGPRGAHPKECCGPPDEQRFSQLVEQAGGLLRLVTLSPEYDASPAFIESLVEHGIAVGIGHTNASPEQIRRAVRAGACLSTHLGNGCHTMLPRHQNYLWAQLAEERLFASLIVDGYHLPPMVVRTMVRAKGVARSILISDLSGLAGLPPGKYASNLCDLEILSNGKIVIAGQSELLAAASFPIGQGIANAVGFARIDLEQAIRMATANPARLLGLPEPQLEAGAPADLILFDYEPSRIEGEEVSLGRFDVQKTLIAGEVVYRDGSASP